MRIIGDADRLVATDARSLETEHSLSAKGFTVTRPILLPDPERIATAVDALYAGCAEPTLVHSEDDPTTDVAQRPFALVCTPLVGLDSLSDAVTVLEAVHIAQRWRLVGLCAPTTIRVPASVTGSSVRFDAWFIHVVCADGATASRLAVPGAPELSGPTSSLDPVEALDRCLRRLLDSDSEAASVDPHR